MINNPFTEEGIIACQCCGSGEYPKPCSTVMAKYGEKEFKVWYSKYGNWMPDGVMTYLKPPDCWRYLTEEEKNGT